MPEGARACHVPLETGMNVLRTVIKAICLGLFAVFALMVAVVVFSDGPPLSCPDYGVEHAAVSPDGAWIAESAVEGCLMGGSTFVLIRRPGEPFQHGQGKRVVSFPDFPTVRFRWVADGILEIGIPNGTAREGLPAEWRGVTLRFTSFAETDEERHRGLVIGRGTVRLAR